MRKAVRLLGISGATAAAVAIALGGVMLATKRPETIERVVYVPVDRSDDPAGGRDAPPLPSAELSSPLLRTDYLELRELVLIEGVNAMPMPHASASPDFKTITPRDAHDESVDWLRRG